MDRQASLERYLQLTATCRRCGETLRLGNCENCPMTEQRRLARRGAAWAGQPMSAGAEHDPPVPADRSGAPARAATRRPPAWSQP